MSTRDIVVENWPAPKGYSNGRVGTGTPLLIGGQIGWNVQRELAAGGLVPQFAQTLDNVLAVVAAAGGRATDIASLTVFVTDIVAYREGQAAIGAEWRERLGKHFPAMALVAVTALVEPDAVVEIQGIAYIQPNPSVAA